MSHKTHQELRDCFGLFATGVMVAAMSHNNLLYGLTINSFASVSLEPPLLLFSIDNKSSNLNAFKEGKYFSLSILSDKQVDLAINFARPLNNDKWQIEPYYFGKFGSPIFTNSIGFFECEVFEVIKAGDHHIFIGKIIDFAKTKSIRPLLYLNGSFFN